MHKVLVVDDDKILQESVKSALEYHNFFVDTANNGVEAVNAVTRKKYDLVVMDVNMPEMDGIELARRATEIDPDMKVMFITGFAAVALNPDSNAPQNAKVLSKPFHLRDLVNEVEKMLAAA